MAENTQEPVYLNYGQSQINQQDFLTAAANQVQDYVAKQPWSNKRKELFMKAYSDIMTQGVTGASNGTGNWMVEYGGSPIDLDSKSKKEREMYGEAAYFIQQQMSQIAPKATEDEKKKELPLFDNAAFNSGLKTQLINGKYGGRQYSPEEWNSRDEANKFGIRGTQQRAIALAEELTNYANSLEDGKYNFEGSPYSDLGTLKAKMLTTADALRNGTWTPDMLNELGINPEEYLSTGANEMVAVGDQQMTRQQYMDYIQQSEAVQLKADQDAKAKEELVKKQQAVQAIKNNPFSKVRIKSGLNRMQGWNPNQIANQFTEATLIDKLNEMASRSDWTPDEQSLAAGAYKHAPKVSISQQEYNTLKAMTRFKDASKSRFSKISGVDGIIYDSATGSLIMAGEATDNEQSDWLAGKSDKDSRKKYLKSSKKGLTSAEWEELASIGFDIASIVDPEMISSAGLALTGSGLRHHAAYNQPGGMSTSDKWWQAADYGLSILGSIPVLGDSALAFRAINNLKKAIVPLGIVMAGANIPQAAKAAYNKVVNGQDLTIQDWRAIGAVLTAAVGYGRGRQMSKRAETLRKTGGTTSKTTKEYAIKTDKGEIKISEQEAKNLEKSLKPHGNNVTKKTEIVRQNEAVKKAAKEQGINLEKASINTESSIRNGKWSPFKNTPEIVSSFKTESIPGSRIATLKAMSEFNKNHGWLARKGLAEQDWILRHTGGYKSTSTSNLTNNSTETSKTPQTNDNFITPWRDRTPDLLHDVKRNSQLSVALENSLNRIESKNFSKRKPSIKENTTTKVGDEKLDIKVTNGRSGKRYKVTSTNGDNTIVYSETSSTETLKKQIAEVIKRQHEKIDVEKIRELKKLFGLKHGGLIQQEDSLQDIIQNFLNNQK